MALWNRKVKEMSGICGVVASRKIHDLRERLDQLSLRLRHRGPDEAVVWNDASAGLALRRLATIDVEPGSQPISNDAGTRWIVCDGEVYNFHHLRAKLIKGGREFHTRTSAEVILHLYEEKKEKCLEELVGAFAFAIYDTEEKSLFLARDRFGEKPLFYTQTTDAFIFSSEIESLLSWPGLKRQMNLHALPYFFFLGKIFEPMTAFADIYQLKPGYWLKLKKNKVTSLPYWTLQYRLDPDIGDEEAAYGIYTRLRQAVKGQMRSHAPIGAFLSGGIDSSTIVGLMAEESSKPIKTFTLKTRSSHFDESGIAREVSDYFATDHHEIEIDEIRIRPDDLDFIIGRMGQPFINPGVIPFHQLSHFAAGEVKAVLTGVGGEDIFGGYPHFPLVQSIEIATYFPRFIRIFSVQTLRLLIGFGLGNEFPLLHQLRNGLSTSLLDPTMRVLHLHTLFREHDVGHIFRLPGAPGSPGSSDSPGAMESKTLSTLIRDDPDINILSESHYSTRLQRFRVQKILPTEVLAYVDRMSMAASLEVRCPFLDHPLAEYAARLPIYLKLRGNMGKYIIRQVSKDLLPSIVIDHPRVGFSSSIEEQFSEDFKDFATGVLASDRIAKHGLFNMKGIRKLVSTALESKKDAPQFNRSRSIHQLLALVCFQLWVDKFGVSMP
jgi:asparagine synthase (glutamine-hydrolysing)